MKSLVERIIADASKVPTYDPETGMHTIVVGHHRRLATTNLGGRLPKRDPNSASQLAHFQNLAFNALKRGNRRK